MRPRASRSARSVIASDVLPKVASRVPASRTCSPVGHELSGTRQAAESCVRVSLTGEHAGVSDGRMRGERIDQRLRQSARIAWRPPFQEVIGDHRRLRVARAESVRQMPQHRPCSRHAQRVQRLAHSPDGHTRDRPCRVHGTDDQVNDERWPLLLPRPSPREVRVDRGIRSRHRRT